MLIRWKNTTTWSAFYRDLYHALCHVRIRLNNLAEEFCCKETVWPIWFCFVFFPRLLKLRAFNDFEAGEKKKKKRREMAGHRVSSQSTWHYFQTWYIWQDTACYNFHLRMMQSDFFWLLRNHAHRRDFNANLNNFLRGLRARVTPCTLKF